METTAAVNFSSLISVDHMGVIPVRQIIFEDVTRCAAGYHIFDRAELDSADCYVSTLVLKPQV
jgi:hypothetical protein